MFIVIKVLKLISSEVGQILHYLATLLARPHSVFRLVQSISVLYFKNQVNLKKTKPDDENVKDRTSQSEDEGETVRLCKCRVQSGLLNQWSLVFFSSSFFPLFFGSAK